MPLPSCVASNKSLEQLDSQLPLVWNGNNNRTSSTAYARIRQCHACKSEYRASFSEETLHTGVVTKAYQVRSVKIGNGSVRQGQCRRELGA